MDLSDWIARWADLRPEKVALRFEGEEISYRSFAARIGRLAAALKGELDVGRGDRVAFLGYNSPEMLDLLFACARLGAILVPLNWRLAAPEHAYILKNCQADVLFAEADFHDHVESIRDGLTETRLVSYGEEAPAGWLYYDGLVGKMAGKWGGPVEARNPHVDYDAPILIVYTSGTTGRPKGAVLTQNALFWNAVNSAHMHDLTSRDHVLTVLPMFHVGGLNIQTLPALHAGATVTLHRRFEPTATLASLAEDRPTLTVLVPATIAALAGHSRWAETDLSSLRLVTTGSSIVPVPVLEIIHGRGIPCIQVYGSTETAPIAIYLTVEDAERKAGSTGKPAVHCDVRLVDATDREVKPGTAGEILVRGPNVMFEYWGDPSATAVSLKDGWFHTGDIAHVDEDGYYWVDERKKDLIVSGGENIYPAELEAVLAESPDIAEAAVVARADIKWGEVPVAVVVRREDSTIGPEEVLALFPGRLAGFKHPKDVVFMEALPRNAMGKVLKYALRDLVG
ncbi:MAG: long-chain fatty acid--CoA ligase [Alphaproteobacteria bacterium]|nr:long-chain fatty acid--CoA ligase [Alphaproteobacteria bacterium]